MPEDSSAEELSTVHDRAETLKRYATPLGEILDGFETEPEYEFVYSGAVDEPTIEEHSED